MDRDMEYEHCQNDEKETNNHVFYALTQSGRNFNLARCDIGECHQQDEPNILYSRD